MYDITLYHLETCESRKIKMPYVPNIGNKIYLSDSFTDFAEHDYEHMVIVKNTEYDITKNEIIVIVETEM
jgi:hypothetical protein